jgi:hypothetical protein
MPHDESILPETLECYKGVLESLQQSKIPYAIKVPLLSHKHTGIWRATKDLSRSQSRLQAWVISTEEGLEMAHECLLALNESIGCEQHQRQIYLLD